MTQTAGLRRQWAWGTRPVAALARARYAAAVAPPKRTMRKQRSRAVWRTRRPAPAAVARAAARPRDARRGAPESPATGRWKTRPGGLEQRSESWRHSGDRRSSGPGVAQNAAYPEGR